MPQPSLLGFLQDKDSQQAVGRGLLDAANRGWIAQTFGAPVDMATQAVNLGIAGAGYLGHKAGLFRQPPELLDSARVPGSSEWIGQKMQNAGMVSPNRNPIAEAGMGLLSPVAFKGAQKVGGLLANAEMKAAENLAAPSTMRMSAQRGAVMAENPFTKGQRVAYKSGDTGVVIGPDPNDPSRILVQEPSGIYGWLIDGITPVGKSAKKGTSAQEMMTLYHGSNEPNLAQIHDGGVFGGLFASGRKEAAASHVIGGRGGVYEMQVSPQEVATTQALEAASSRKLAAAKREVAKMLPSGLKPSEVQEVLDLARSGTGLYDGKVDAKRVASLLGESDIAEADWALQRMRGQIARAMGYKAVEMPDEHGVSYLVLPGVPIKRSN